MSEELFGSPFVTSSSVTVPRHGICMVDGVLQNAGYTEVIANLVDEDTLHQLFKASPWACHRLWQQNGRTYMFDKWVGHKDRDGYEEPDAVVIRDVTDLLEKAP